MKKRLTPILFEIMGLLGGSAILRQPYGRRGLQEHGRVQHVTRIDLRASPSEIGEMRRCIGVGLESQASIDQVVDTFAG
jgi:hypothetical protein